MKKLIASLIVLLAPVAFAASGPTTLVNEGGLSYNNTYPMNLNAPSTGANKLSVQITFSSASIPAQTFSNGAQSTGSITVASNNILAKFATNTITVPPTNQILPQPATSQITISSAVAGSIIFVNGNTLTEGVQWFHGASSATAAASLSAAINANIGAVTTNNVGAVIYATATVPGAAGNAFTVTSSSPPAYSTTSFSGGTNDVLANMYFTFNGSNHRNGKSWTEASTSSGTAVNIVALLNSFGIIQATVPLNGSVIYTTATLAGMAANNYTLSSSGGLVIGTPNFTGGQDNGTITINGVHFVAGINFSTGTTAQTATNLAAAITAATADGTNAAAVGSVVVATSAVIGANQNFSMTSSTDAALTLSGPKTVTNGASVGVMTGGKNTSYTLNSAIIAIPNHGFTKALPVLYSGTPAIGGLATGTTYFVVVVDANDIMLSSTSVVAQAGNGIVITSSSSQTTSNTYTLAPLSYTAGSAGGFWQISNDGTTWSTWGVTQGNVVVSSQSYTATTPPTVATQDFGPVDYGWVRYNVTAPTQGAVTLKVITNGKD